MGQVLSEAKNEPTTNWPGLMSCTSRPTSSTMPTVLVPHRRRLRDLLDATVGPEVRAAHAGGRRFDDGVGRFDNLGIRALLEAHIAWTVQHRSLHGVSPSLDLCSPRGGNYVRSSASTPRSGALAAESAASRDDDQFASSILAVKSPAWLYDAHPRCRRTGQSARCQ